MPVITVQLWKGRTRGQKAELARRITDAMVEVADCERDTVRVIFDDYEKSDWAVGGRLADEPEQPSP
jgi:4-oxalocrotonate tautomerase